MANKMVYMIGIEPEYWTMDDEKACKKHGVKVCGYYELGNNEGMILVGTYKNLNDVCEDWFGVEIVDEYLNDIDDFDYEDGRWITGGWYRAFESRKNSVRKIKESSSAYSEFLNNYKIKGELRGEVDDFRDGGYYYGDIVFAKDGIYAGDSIDGNEIFIDGNDIVDYIDVGMGASDFAFNIGDGKSITKYSIHVTIARKFRGNISLR